MHPWKLYVTEPLDHPDEYLEITSAMYVPTDGEGLSAERLAEMGRGHDGLPASIWVVRVLDPETKPEPAPDDDWKLVVNDYEREVTYATGLTAARAAELGFHDEDDGAPGSWLVIRVLDPA